MSVREPDFQQQVALTALIHNAYTNRTADFATITTALASDVTTHSAEIEAPPAALRMGPANSHFTNDVLLLVNVAKAGNLPTASIIAAIDGVAGVLSPPGVVDIPYVSGATVRGSVLNCTQGNWVGTPSSYAYAWKRNGAVAVGTNANTYTTVVADVGSAIGCVVTATNATGSTPAPISNTIVVT